MNVRLPMGVYPIHLSYSLLKATSEIIFKGKKSKWLIWHLQHYMARYHKKETYLIVFTIHQNRCLTNTMTAK